MTLLCETSRHREDERPETQPAWRVCYPCGLNIERDTLDACRLHASLALDQAWRTPSAAPRVSGTRERPMPIIDRKAGARVEIETTLYSWAGLVVDERKFGAPRSPSVEWAGTMIMSSSSWLAAHDLAVQCCDELYDLAHGWVLSVARPSGTARASAGACPLCAAPAEAVLRPADDERESAIVCTVNREHRWAPHEWSVVVSNNGSQGARVDTAGAAALLRIDERSLRQLHSRGKIERTEAGFDLRELERLYGELWGTT